MTNATSAARIADTDSPPSVARFTRPKVVLAGPEAFTLDEMRTIKFALEDRKASVTSFRMTDEFRMQEFADAVEGCTWVLIAVNEFPGRELELLRITERAKLPRPKAGIICLASRVNVSGRLHVGGQLDLVVKRVPGDRSLSDGSRTNHTMVLAEDLTNEAHVLRIARAIVPSVPD